jgi:hypothetical protein
VVTGIANLAGNGNLNPNETLTSTSTAPVNVTYSYSVSANGCTNATTYNVIITVNPTPPLNSSLAPAAICSGTVFNYLPTSTTTGASFSWTRAAVTGISNIAGNGNGTISETLTNTITNQVNVAYIFTVSANNCTNSTSYNVMLTVNPLPWDPNFTPYSTTVCSGSQNVSFTLDSVQNNVSFSWTAINATSASFWTATPNAVFNFGSISPAVITLRVTNTVTGCSNIHSENITVSGNQAPSPPPISIINTNWLVCQLNGSGITYQWGYDSLPTLSSHSIPGAVFQQYNATDYPNNSKAYWVMVKDGNCFSKSYLNNLFLNINTPVNDQMINLFPNPAGSSLNISCPENIIAIQIFEISGRLAFEKQILYPQNFLDIDVKEMSNGIYLAGLETLEHHKFFKKLIIQH